MKINYPRITSALFAALAFCSTAHADSFGTSGNEFTIDFVSIGNAGNAADTVSFTAPTYYGAVPYEYRMGTYEISQNAIAKAQNSGMTDVTAGAWAGNQPAANINWYEAGAFVNWLNVSTGKTAAYNLTWDGNDWSMTLWSSEQAWTAGGTNLYRNKDAFYFLPSEDEWYKAAYYNPTGSDYFLYPTASASIPSAVASGTDAGSAVYNGVASVPAIVDSAGGLSPYGTMGQGGNVWEFLESAYEGPNILPGEDRAIRAGDYTDTGDTLRASFRSYNQPSGPGLNLIGFRVASVDVIPEPSTYALLLMAGGAWLLRKRLRRSL